MRLLLNRFGKVSVRRRRDFNALAGGSEYPSPDKDSSQKEQLLRNPRANSDPKLAYFILEKPKGATSWKDSAAREGEGGFLKRLVDKQAGYRGRRSRAKQAPLPFLRDRRALDEIPSSNCRRVIHELVEDQNKDQWTYNRSLLWTLTSVYTEWRKLDFHRLKPWRVEIMLETEFSGSRSPQIQRLNGKSAERDVYSRALYVTSLKGRKTIVKLLLD